MKRETLMLAATASAVTVAAAAAVFGAGVVDRHLTAGPAVVQDGNDIAGISAAQSADPGAVKAYLRAHPVPARPGMTAGIITSVTELGDQPGTGLDSVPCDSGTRTTAYLAPAVGQDPCAAWSFTVTTAGGGVLSVSCGGIGRPCLAAQNVIPGDEGEYLYVPSSGQVAPAAPPVAFIGCWTSAGYPCPFSAAVIP